MPQGARPETGRRVTGPDGPLATVAILIPAYRPDRTLVSVLEQLAGTGFPNIVVVNDGSGPAYDSVFASAALIPGVQIVRHAVNLGKGAALKTGINHTLCSFPDIVGIVTADADGQHLPVDILRVAQRLLDRPSALILGSRAFDGDVPLRSRIGNGLTRNVMRTLVGASLADTQTGLRAIPSAFASSLLRMTANGYEFELDMLIAARQSSMEVVEVPIQTVYEPGNKSSHFNPLTDSMRIYFVLLRFTSVSLVTALIDNLIFYFTWHGGARILTAQILARSIAALFNYVVVRKAVFQTRRSYSSTFPRFFALGVVLGSISYTFIRLLVDRGHFPVLATKIAVESLLFCASFIGQRDWVFRRSESPAPAPNTLPPAVPLAPRKLPSWKAAVLWLVLLIPAAVEISGFRSTHLFAQTTWEPSGYQRFGLYLGFSIAVCVAFGLFARRYFVPAAVAGVVVCSIYAVGIAPVGAVLLFLFSATILGRLLFGESTDGPLALLGGIGVWIGAMYLVSRVPIHYPVTYLVALGVPVVLGYRQSRRLALSWLDVLRPRLRLSTEEFLGAALLSFVLIANWLVVLKPEVSTDGLSTHLTIPMSMALHHAYTIDFRQFIWALMPIGTDFCYSVVYSLGGEYASRLLNFAMLSGMALLLFRAVRSFVPSATAALLTALFVSSPMVYLVTGSMFVENFVAFMVLGAVVALWRLRETPSPGNAMLAAVLLGTAMALKLGAIAVAAPGMIVMSVLVGLPASGDRPSGRSRPRLAAAAIVVALVLGSIPYATAWRLTGNPFFPFQTGPFKSSFVGNDIRDFRFNPPLLMADAHRVDVPHESLLRGAGWLVRFPVPPFPAPAPDTRTFKTVDAGEVILRPYGDPARRRRGVDRRGDPTQRPLFLLHDAAVHRWRCGGTRVGSNPRPFRLRNDGWSGCSRGLRQHLVPAIGRLEPPGILLGPVV